MQLTKLGQIGRFMPGEHETNYFARRAREEREKAENAPDPRSYRLHLELAREYETRARHAHFFEQSRTANRA